MLQPYELPLHYDLMAANLARCRMPHLNEVIGVICRVLRRNPQLCTALQARPTCISRRFAA
jgi:hypothetical protein